MASVVPRTNTISRVERAFRNRRTISRAFSYASVARLAERVYAAMHVGVPRGLVVFHRAQHRQRLLRGRGAVEIHQRLAVDLARQDRKLARTRATSYTGAGACGSGRCRVDVQVRAPIAMTSGSWPAAPCSAALRSCGSSMARSTSPRNAHLSNARAVLRSMPRASR